MSVQLSPKHVNITIENYIQGFKNEEYTMPIWQRQECWVSTYRKSLIESIMIGIDLPKLYIGEVSLLGKIIIDGGHRTRAIDAYLRNEFPISIGNMLIYYNETKADTKNSRIMNETEKAHIDNYKLTLCIYEDLNESMARKIFNKLQNAVPMSVPDVVNSFESPLVDTLREILEFEVNDIPVKDYFAIIKCLPKSENNEDIYQLLSWITICWPVVSGSNKVEALRWIEKGTTRNSKCFQYLLNFDDQFNEVTDEMKEVFKDFLTTTLTILNNKNIKIPGSDLNSLCHSIKWIPEFDIDKFWLFFETVQEFNGEKTRAKKCNSKGQYSAASELNVHADSINSNYNLKLSEWIGSRTKGGSGEDGMKVRLEIIKSYCLKEETIEDNDENDDQRNVLENMVEEIPVSTTV